MTHYAPIALFVYNRLDVTQQAVAALQKNNLAKSSRLYIFSDAAKSEAGKHKVEEVRKYLSSIDGFLEVNIILSPENKGCANSIISGVSKVFEQYEKIIVVEDDLITTPNFLDYMNSALDYYADKNIGSIGGYGFALNFEKNDRADVYYLPRCCAWGWASWKDRWEKIDWAVSDYETFRNNQAARKKFNLGGNDMSQMLDDQMQGKIDTWDIRLCYAQHKAGMLTVYPKMSKVENIGFGPDATHTSTNPNFKITLDHTNRTAFNFESKVEIDDRLLKQFTAHFNYSPFHRFKNWLKNYIPHWLLLLIKKRTAYKS